MRKRKLIRGIIFLVIGFAWLAVAIYFNTKDESVEDKLKDISFELKDNEYSREVKKDDETYKEIINVDKNEYSKIYNTNNEKKIYTYNYEKDSFTYEYYVENILTSTLKYHYPSDNVTEDNSNIYESLKGNINMIKTSFEELLYDNDINKEDL